MQQKRPIQVAVTGAAGQIGYALLFRIASGQMFGPDHQVVLRLLEVEAAMRSLEGVAMELADSGFDLLADVVITADTKVAFDGASWALLVGSAPRKAGMERRDLLGINGGIFGPQGAAIAANAADDIRTVVVGNPCNTNASIARAHAPEIPDDRWFSMTRLDHNRACYQLANKAGVPLGEVTNMAIWGNHSMTQYPDFAHARISGRPAPEVVDPAWLRGPFIDTVQARGAAVIEARGASSAGSAASAIIDTVVSISQPTPEGDWTSVAVPSKGQYGVPEGYVFGFPVRSDGVSVEVVEGLDHDAFASERIQASIAELQAEREEIKDMLRP